VAHRITGVLIFFFLFAHVLDTALVRVSKSDYNTVIGSYKNPITNFLEYGLTAAIVFHAFNGLRIIAIDFWAKGARYQRRMLWIVVGVSENRTPFRTRSTWPRRGCGSRSTMPSALTCGSLNTSAKSLIAQAGTSSASSRPSQWARVLVRKIACRPSCSAS